MFSSLKMGGQFSSGFEKLEASLSGTDKLVVSVVPVVDHRFAQRRHQTTVLVGALKLALVVASGHVLVQRMVVLKFRIAFVACEFGQVRVRFFDVIAQLVAVGK